MRARTIGWGYHNVINQPPSAAEPADGPEPAEGVIIHSQILPLARVEQALRRDLDAVSAPNSTSRPLSQATPRMI